MNELAQSVIDAAISTSIFEWTAVSTALIYVWLASRENSVCWPFGIASTILYIIICFNVSLYIETLLQGFYLGIGIYGWIMWTRKNNDNKTIIHFSTSRSLVLLFISGSILSVITGYVFHRFTSTSQPFLDASISVFSIIATWMSAKKMIENWLCWIIIDLSAIILYENKNLHLTALLYFIYSAMALYGFILWKKKIPKIS